MLLKRALKGTLDLMGPAMAVQKELMAIPTAEANGEAALAAETAAIESLKKATLMVAGAAVQKFGTALEKEQEIIMHLADMIIEVFACESALLAVKKINVLSGDNASRLEAVMLQVYLSDAVERVGFSGRQAINAFGSGDELRMLQLGLKRFTKPMVFNTKEGRRQVADKLIQENKYCF
jgi:hypothetical protein